MQREAYYAWLAGTLGQRSVKDSASRCKRIEIVFGVDLDQEFKRDGCETMFTKINCQKLSNDQKKTLADRLGLRTVANLIYVLMI